MSQYFPKPYEPFGGGINVKVDLSNYATKSDFKNLTHVDVSSFALKTTLANLKSEVDKLDIDKLVLIPVDLSKLTDAVNNDVVKKTKYIKLVTKVDNTDTTNFVSRTKYEKDRSDFEDKISKVDEKNQDVSDLIKKTDLNAKITDVENKIPSITSALTSVENKIPDVSSLATKTDFDAKLKGISDRVSSNKSKHLLVENELKKLEKFEAAYFKGKNYFDGNDGTQNYLVFQSMQKYFEETTSKIPIKIYAASWKSKGLSDDKITSVTGFTHPTILHGNPRIRLRFDGSILRRNAHTSLVAIANFYMVYRLSPRIISSNIVLKDCLFGKIKMTKNADTDKYKYEGHSICFDSTVEFTHQEGNMARNVIFGADMADSKQADNKTKNALILGRGFMQKIDGATTQPTILCSCNVIIT